MKTIYFCIVFQLLVNYDRQEYTYRRMFNFAGRRLLSAMLLFLGRGRYNFRERKSVEEPEWRSTGPCFESSSTCPTTVAAKPYSELVSTCSGRKYHGSEIALARFGKHCVSRDKQLRRYLKGLKMSPYSPSSYAEQKGVGICSLLQRVITGELRQTRSNFNETEWPCRHATWRWSRSSFRRMPPGFKLS